MKPLVSVCIPAYNNEKTIAESIQSVLNQSYQNLELVIIDDHSSDRTLEIARAFSDNRIRILENEKNLGMAGNWNACIKVAKGQYIKLLCADDLLKEKAVQKEALALYRNPLVDLVMSDTELIDIHGTKTGAFKRFPISGVMDGKKLARISLLINNFFGAPLNNMFRRSAAEKVGGFDASFQYILDFDFWVSLAGQGQIYIIHELLNQFRIRKDSNTGDVMGSGKQGQAYLREHRKLLVKHQKRKDVKIGPIGFLFSMAWRRIRSYIIHIYLKIFTK